MPSKNKQRKGKKKNVSKKKDADSTEVSCMGNTQAQSKKDNLNYVVLEDRDVIFVNDNIKNNNESKSSESPFNTFVSNFEVGNTPKIQEDQNQKKLDGIVGSKIKFESFP